MKRFLDTFMISVIFFAMVSSQNMKSESHVYFFWDHKMGWEQIPIEINGEYSFSIIPELSNETAGIKIYNKAVRKVTFPTEGRYVVSITNTWFSKPYHAEIILNLEDGETYYVVLDCTITNPFFFKELNKKDGEKLFQKASKNSKKYTFNPDYTYEK